ncbi:MAG: oligosaccharide flippase family protein, partial [Gammaproteobacteria bacterium]|nr:oligosaccharide flippase family protein [Gammaproteobacteria bacterium]
MPLKRIWQRLDQEAGELVRGASLALVIRTAGALITFGLNVLIARRLGVDQTGAFFLALTVATLASVIARAGAPNTVLRFVAANAADNGWNTVRAAYRRGLSICIGVGVAVTAVIVLLAPLLAERVFGQPEIRSALVAMALLIMPTATFRLSSMALQGLGRVADAALSSMALLPGFAIVFLLLLPDTDLLLT